MITNGDGKMKDVTLPYLFEEEVKALIRSGVYSSTSDAVKDAFRFLFENKPMLRNTAAVKLYKEGKVTIGRAAEIVGVTTIEFKDMLADRGIVREISPILLGIYLLSTGKISGRINFFSGVFGFKYWI